MNDTTAIVDAYEKVGLRRLAGAVIACASEDLTKYILKGYVDAKTLKIQDRLGGVIGKHLAVDDVTSAVELFTKEGPLEALLGFRPDALEYASAIRSQVRRKAANLAGVADQRFIALSKATRMNVTSLVKETRLLSRTGSQERDGSR